LIVPNNTMINPAEEVIEAHCGLMLP